MHKARFDRHGDVTITLRLGEKDWEAETSYRNAHRRIAKKRGSAAEHSCVTCGQQAAEWAYNHLDLNERIDPTRGLRYSCDPSYYSPMCRKCHAAFDDSIHPKFRGIPVRGEGHGKAKLTDRAVRQIRSAATAGERYLPIAKRHGVTVSTVSRIVRREMWAHVPDCGCHPPTQGHKAECPTTLNQQEERRGA